MLAEWLINHPGALRVPFVESPTDFKTPSKEIVHGQRVLELGSGIGFLGIIIASLQQSSTTDLLSSSHLFMTDANESVLERCRDNIALSPSKRLIDTIDT